MTSGALAFAITEAIGLIAAIWPTAWLGLFGHDPRMLETFAALAAALVIYGVTLVVAVRSGVWFRRQVG